MYKAKKHWIVALFFLGVLGAVGLATDNVQAAELDTQPGTTTVQPDNPNPQSRNETLKTAVSEEAALKDTTSQPTTAEEVVPKELLLNKVQLPQMIPQTSNNQQQKQKNQHKNNQ